MLNVALHQADGVTCADQKRFAMHGALDVRVPVDVSEKRERWAGEAAQAMGHAARQQVVPSPGDLIDEREEKGAHLANVDDKRAEGHCA